MKGVPCCVAFLLYFNDFFVNNFFVQYFVDFYFFYPSRFYKFVFSSFLFPLSSKVKYSVVIWSKK